MIVGRRGLFIAQPNQQQEHHTQQRRWQWQWQWLDFQAICCSSGLKVESLLYPDAVWIWEPDGPGLRFQAQGGFIG